MKIKEAEKNGLENLPIIDLKNKVVEGELTIVPPKINLGKVDLTVSKTVSKFTFDDEGKVIGTSIFDDQNWELQYETETEAKYKQTREFSMLFPQKVEQFQLLVEKTAFLLGVIEQIMPKVQPLVEKTQEIEARIAIEGNTKELTDKLALVGLESIGQFGMIEDDLKGWVELVTSPRIGEGEELDFVEQINLFNLYRQNNVKLTTQVQVFLAKQASKAVQSA